MSLAGPDSLLHDRNVALVWAAGLVSMLGNLAMFVALPVAVFDSTGSAWATALTVLAGSTPTVLVGQIAGVVADRVNRRRLSVAANATMALLTCIFLVLPSGSWWMYAAVNLLVSSAAQFASPAEHALLGDLVPQDRLGEGASLNSLSTSLARLIGPALGGLAFAQLGLWATATLDALTFAIAAILVGLVTCSSDPVDRSRPDGVFAAAWWHGMHRIWSHPQLRAIVALAALTSIGEGAISALMAPFAREILGAGADILGAVLTAQAIGGIAGAAWASRKLDQKSPLGVFGTAAVVAGGLLAVIFNYALIYPQWWPAVVLTAAAGFPLAVVAATQGFALQIYAPADLRGRVYSLTFSILGVAQLFGTLLAGIAGDRWGPFAINIDAAVYLASGAIALWLTKHRSGNSPLTAKV